MNVFNIKRGDLLPTLSALLLQSDGTPAPVLGSATVRLFMADASGSLVIDGGLVTVDDIDTGAVSYAWEAGETATAGTYRAEFEVDYGGVKQTYPTSGFVTVNVVADLG